MLGINNVNKQYLQACNVLRKSQTSKTMSSQYSILAQKQKQVKLTIFYTNFLYFYKTLFCTLFLKLYIDQSIIHVRWRRITALYHTDVMAEKMWLNKDDFQSLLRHDRGGVRSICCAVSQCLHTSCGTAEVSTKIAWSRPSHLEQCSNDPPRSTQWDPQFWVSDLIRSALPALLLPAEMWMMQKHKTQMSWFVMC